MKGWRVMRAALSHFWGTPHHHEPPTVAADFDLQEFEARLVETERRLQDVEERRRLQILALESEIPRGHRHEGH